MPRTPPETPKLTNRQRQAQRRRVERRSELAERAAELFEAKGYFETTVGDIAEAAGMTKATIYHYFSAKDEILYHIHESFTRRLLEEHAATLERTDDPLEQLRAMFESFCRVMADSGPQVRAFFASFDELKGEHRAAIEERRQQLSEMVEDVVRRAIERGELREVDVRLTMLVMTGVFNWAPHWYRANGRLRPPELADFVFGLVVDGLRPRRDDERAG
jgi:AcrR family transcriptional regulator